MKRVELLSPVGNKEMLISAINNGADAIYMAGKMYGARKYADNFSKEEIIEAINYAHLYGVKVYITVNTLIYEKEIEEFINYIKFLYEANVDAVIMQDLGMIKLVRELYPDLEIHASTQFHNHSKVGVNYLKEIGVSRVVLARELTLEEIKQIDVDIKKEIFVYGALCISYSGQCLMSSCLLNRSGNRGECAGMCRLPYELYENDKQIKTPGEYLLSPKELNTLSNLREIIDSGVDSLKIEGRMKSAEYVGYVTRVYRRLIDCYYNNEEMNVTSEELNNLKKLYNRDFTLGHLFKDRNNKLMNIKSPNHIGTHLGIASIDKNKIKIELSDNIKQGDGIRFANNQGMIVNYLYNENMLLINSASKGEIVYVDNKVDLNISNKEVIKTYDVALSEKIKDIPMRKVDINIEVIAKIGQPLIAKVTDFKNTVTKSLGNVEESIKCPVKIDELVDRFSKLNDTVFRLKDIRIDADKNIFIPVKVMNELRRNIISELEQLRILNNRKLSYGNYDTKHLDQPLTNTLNILVRNEKQLTYLLDKNVNIYTNDILLYRKYKGENVFLVTDRVAYDYRSLNDENILASNLSSVITYCKENNVFSDTYLNVTNSYSLENLIHMGVKKVGLSIENNFEDIKNIINAYKKRQNSIPNVDILIYGRVELMVLKHCFLNMFINKDINCSVCRGKNKYFLKDRNSKMYPIINNNCNTYILHYKNIDLIDKINDYKAIGINNFTIYLYDEDEKEIEKILNRINFS